MSAACFCRGHQRERSLHQRLTRPCVRSLGKHFGLLKASDMILLNEAGEAIGGNMSRPANSAGFLIHAAVHKARPDVNAACHTHSPYGKAWSTFARPLEMINQDVCNFYGDAQAVYGEFAGVVFTEEEGQRLAKALGPNGKGMILRNHGLLTVGKTVDEAAYLYTLMERSCEMQLLADAAAANGLKKQIISDEAAEFSFKASDAVSAHISDSLLLVDADGISQRRRSMPSSNPIWSLSTRLAAGHSSSEQRHLSYVIVLVSCIVTSLTQQSKCETGLSRKSDIVVQSSTTHEIRLQIKPFWAASIRCRFPAGQHFDARNISGHKKHVCSVIGMR